LKKARCSRSYLHEGFLAQALHHEPRTAQILLAYMALTQAVKGFCIRQFGWQ
jgi:hypothetical protein